MSRKAKKEDIGTKKNSSSTLPKRRVVIVKALWIRRCSTTSYPKSPDCRNALWMSTLLQTDV
ncbi:unnamed protein product, partial [Nesidiocoris tenuis]